MLDEESVVGVLRLQLVLKQLLLMLQTSNLVDVSLFLFLELYLLFHFFPPQLLQLGFQSQHLFLVLFDDSADFFLLERVDDFGLSLFEEEIFLLQVTNFFLQNEELTVLQVRLLGIDRKTYLLFFGGPVEL